MANLFKFKPPSGLGSGSQVTGKAADSGYTVAKAAQQQAANRQTVQNLWNSGQAKAAQDNSTNKAYTAKLTGGATIDNSNALVGNLQNTFSGYKDSATEQYDRTYASKLGKGENWSSPKSAVGNVLMSAAADTTAGWLNAAGTALKSNRKSGLAVDSGAVPAKTTGNEWYNRAGNYLQREADRAQQIGKIAYHRGGYGLNNAQKLLYDAGIAGTQMATDLALGTLTGGSATIPMAIRSFGSGAMEARQAGASENQQIFYGAANALAEAATEKMFDGVARIYGKGMADDMVDEFAKRWAKSEGGQALIRGAAGMGGEGLEEVVSSLANPALKTIYNGKSLRENYSDLDLNDVVYEGMIGALLGNIGGAVNIAQTGRGNTQNYQQGNSRAFGGQMRSTSPADVLRNANLNTLYTAAESNAQRSTPYAAAHATSVQQQRSTPYTGTAGPSQPLSYADVFRQMQAAQERATDSEYARYKELERKYLNGNIKAEEFEELRILDNVWGQFDADAKENGRSLNDRYRKLEQKFRNGNINEQEWNEMIRLENTLKQPNAPSKRTGTDGASEYARYKELERKFVDGNINEKEWKELIRSEDIRAEYEESRTPDVFKKKEVETFNDSSIMLSGGVLDEFDRKSTWMEYNEDIAWVNPNYSTNKFEWQYNCQRCVSAYEMRRRGFDVTAKPLPTESLEEDFLAQRAECAWKDAIRRWCMKGNGKEQVEAFMRNWGDGARAIVGIGFKGRFGHVFIAEQRNGRTIYIDPQTGSADCSSYFENALKGQTYIVRIDTLTPTNVIFDCCKNRR